MDQGQRRLEVGVRQVGEHRPELRGREHALVGERLGRQADHVEGAAGICRNRILHRQLDAFADDVQRALEAGAGVGSVERRGAAHEHLFEDRSDRGGVPANGSEVGRHRTPADHRVTLLPGDAFDDPAQQRPCLGLVGQKYQPGAVGPGRRQGQSGDATQEPVGHLHQDAGAVAGVGVGARGATVFEVDEQGQRIADDGRRATALDVGDEADAAGVVLIGGAVQTRLHTIGSGRATARRARATLVALIVLRCMLRHHVSPLGPSLERTTMHMKSAMYRCQRFETEMPQTCGTGVTASWSCSPVRMR